MSQATIAAETGISFKVVIVSSFGRSEYRTRAASSSDAWMKAADYCGDAACAITVMPASVQ